MSRSRPRARLRGGFVLLALALTMGGCADGVSTPTSSPDAVPTPSVTQAPEPVPAVATILVRPEGLDLVDATGSVVTQLSYDAPTDQLVDALADAFGGLPELDEHPVGYETPQRDVYRWEGFEVWDDLVGHVEGDDPATWTWIPDDAPDTRDMNVTVVVLASAVGDVEVVSSNGVHPGDDADSVAAMMGIDPGSGQILLETGPELGPREFPDSANAYSVVLQSGGGLDASRMVAPINAGVGGV